MSDRAKASRFSGERTPAVRVRAVRKTFGPVVAVDSVDLDLRSGETFALLGPSGCGKTTLLRMIAGLERPDAGMVEIAGRLVDGPGAHVPPERRRVGMVFQDVALFPHLSVAENVGYGIDRGAGAGREARIGELLELVGLGDAGRLRPHELSGGMQQRVALARALGPGPDVVLLDEPFANLDLSLRTQLRGEVRRVLQVTGTTALFVTHDQSDALTLADRVAVMRRGSIDQVATPERIYAEPETPFVATFVGVANLVPGRVRGGIAQTRLGMVGVGGRTADGYALVLVRPEHCDILPDDGGDQGTIARGLRGNIVGRRFAGSELLFEIAPDDGGSLWIEAGPLARQLQIGDPVRVTLRAQETVAFPSRTEA
jgi:iron(III) transport system ATP-binding protein